MKLRRHSSMLVVFLFVGLLVPASSGAEPIHLGNLGVNQFLFWDGGYGGSSPTYSLPLAPSSASFDRCAHLDPCFVYTLDLVGSGQVLRIALDTPMRDDGFEISIVSPSGQITRRTP